jgi:predicted enzyme related to lactoylglutathione lyase
MEEETMNPVVHFEMPYDNRERMATFYGSAFGWQTQMLGEDMGHYVLATTTDTDEKGPKTPGAINGGFFPRKPDWPAQHRLCLKSRFCDRFIISFMILSCQFRPLF